MAVHTSHTGVNEMEPEKLIKNLIIFQIPSYFVHPENDTANQYQRLLELYICLWLFRFIW